MTHHACDRFTIRDAALGQFDLHAETSQQSFNDHLEMDLALAGDDGLVEFVVHVVVERRILRVHRGQSDREFIFLACGTQP